MCFGDIQVDKVSEVSLNIFGPDHAPSPKDIAGVARPRPAAKNQEGGVHVDYHEDFVEDVYLEGDVYGYHGEYDEENYDDYEEDITEKKTSCTTTRGTTITRPTRTMCRRT